MKMIFNVICGNAPEYLTTNIVYINKRHNINRKKNILKFPLFRTEIGKQNLFYKSLNISMNY